MTTARLIEHQITRQILARRESESRRKSADRVIKGVAWCAFATLITLCLPQLLLPIFLVSVVFTLGM